MTLFYFDFVHNDDIARDDVGQEFPDEKAAHREAVRALAEIAAEEIPRDGKLVLSVSVCDADRRTMFQAQLVFNPQIEASCESS